MISYKIEKRAFLSYNATSIRMIGNWRESMQEIVLLVVLLTAVLVLSLKLLIEALVGWFS
jgi:hypothetical protein